MNYLLDKILNKEIFSFEEASAFIHAIEEDRLTAEIISGILIGIQLRGVQLEELKGFRQALLELSITPDIDVSEAIDLCGTGGDGKDTFNISTTSAFVLAAMGKRVIKHGNYGVSSSCGSSNVLEALGVKFSSNSDELNRSLNERNICFLHAPLFHPTMKKVARIRKNLGVRTIFNSLGPLVNPVQPEYQLTGTYSLELAKVYQHLLKDQRTDFRVVYGMDGYDEITLTDDTRVFGKHVDTLINAAAFNANSVDRSEIISGLSINSSAQIIRNILKGKGTLAQNQVVAANVATALQVTDTTQSLNNLFANSLEFIKSGKAIQQLN
ncbi:MAG: anthranilate phosphoribosyltransferase [Crocinitomicaceae bacterium]|nr:anthranilate phosphoribosyltransferase [Crocinitomicaceae bacterium]